MADSKAVRLEGVINHVLRRRIVRSERQIIPRSLRPLDPQYAPEVAASRAPDAEQAFFAMPQPPSAPQHYAYAQNQNATIWMPHAHMQAVPVVTWMFQQQMPPQMNGWFWQPSVGPYGAPYQPQEDLINAVLRVPSSAHAPVSQTDDHASAPELQRIASLAGCAGRAPSLATRCPSVASRCPSVASRCPSVSTRCPSVATSLDRSSSAVTQSEPTSVAPSRKRAADQAPAKPSACKVQKLEPAIVACAIEQALKTLQAKEDELKRKQEKIDEIEEDPIFSDQAELNWFGIEFARTASSFLRTSSSAGASLCLCVCTCNTRVHVYLQMRYAPHPHACGRMYI